MKHSLIALAVGSALAASSLSAQAGLLDGATKAWTYTHSATNGSTSGFLSEIVTHDKAQNQLWVSGVTGVDVLNASTGLRLGHIDTSSFGSINSVAISNGVAAFAIESPTRTGNGIVQLYDTTTRSLLSGTNTITVGALPDMLTFTPDGSKLLVANEATPSTAGYGVKTTSSSTFAPNFAAATNDPVGSVSIINMSTRSVVATANPNTAPRTGSHIRTNTGMDFEPEYIAVNAAGTKAYVSLQEANAMGVLDIASGTFSKVVGLGVKDFSLAGNRMDPLNNGTFNLISPAVKGLYMPDGVATFEANGQTFIAMANEGDFREDDKDRAAASGVGATSPLNNLRVSNTDSSAGNLFAAGARSFSIRDADGNLVYDSGEILDREAAALGLYDDGRSRDKGVEPEGMEVMTINGRQVAFVGLERTTKSAVAAFDVTDPANSVYLTMLVSDGEQAPEGLKGYEQNGKYYLAWSAEGGSPLTGNRTTVFELAKVTAAVPEPETYALLLAGAGVLGAMARRRKAA